MQRHPIRTHRRRLRASPCRASAAASDMTAPPAVRRSLCITEFSRAASSSVWYYQVDITVTSTAVNSNNGSSNDTGFDGHANLSGDESDDSGYASPRCSLDRVVQRYSVLRRYNDFLDLYGRVKEHLAATATAKAAIVAATVSSGTSDTGSTTVITTTNETNDTLPPFPVKEFLSPSVFGTLWRLSSPRHVLEERRGKFETLLQFIEQHAVARSCAAFERFLGQPPQRQDGGYVSLKEYTAQNWLAGLKQLARAKLEQRQRHYSMDAAHLAQLIDGVTASIHTIATTAAASESPAFLGKRRRRVRPGSASCSAAAASSSALLLAPTSETQPQPQLQLLRQQQQLAVAATVTKRATTTREQDARPCMKRSKSFHHHSQRAAPALCVAVPT